MIKPAAIAACMVFIFASSTLAGQSGDYIGLSLGLMIVKEHTVTDRENSTADINYDPGMAVSAFLGRQFDSGLRVDGELFYKNIHTKKFKYLGQNNSIDSKVQSTGTMANFYYNYYHSLKDSPFSPYFGAGIGFANVQMSAGSDSRLTYWNEDDDLVFAYQVILGSSIPLRKDILLDLSYRYQGSSDITIDQIKTNLDSHNIMLGVIYYFR